METKPYNVFFCKRYGQLAGRVCPRINSDDWDELEDCCQNCSCRGVIETEVEVFNVVCKKDSEMAKKGDMAKAYVWGDEHFVVNGLICHINEFQEHFEVV